MKKQQCTATAKSELREHEEALEDARDHARLIERDAEIEMWLRRTRDEISAGRCRIWLLVEIDNKLSELWPKDKDDETER